MIKSKSFSFGFVLLFFITTINAQIGIGTTNPQGALDITSANQGLLIPRVSLTANTDAITVLTPTISELVYNTNTSAVGSDQVTPGYYYWDGSLWIRLASGNSNNNWSILGNAGLNESTNFLGTTDGVDVVFKRNNLLAGRLAELSTAFGLGALNSTAAGQNVAFGNNAMAAHTSGIENTAVGFNALQRKTTGAANTAIGHSALNEVGTFERATAVGFQALFKNTANDNTGIGFQALRENTSGIRNTSLGFQAGALNTVGSNNTVIGHLAAYFNQSSNNTAIGYNALNAAAGANNVAVGSGALALNRAANNTALGYQAGAATTTGTGNVFIGNLAGSAESGETSNKLYISNSGTTATTSLIYGEFNNNILRTNGQLQIGNPAGTGYAFPTTDGTAGQYLQTNGNGAVSWANQSDSKSVMRVNISANQALGAGGWQKILFNTVVFDTNSEFNNTDNRFVANTAGYYQINAGFHTNNQSNFQFYSVGVYVNGTLYQETTGNHISNGPVSRNINCIVSLNATDYVEIFVQNSETGDVQIDSFTGKTFFEVQQIR